MSLHVYLLFAYVDNKLIWHNHSTYPRNAGNKEITFNLENNMIKCEETVKLLEVMLDFRLNFNFHISNILKSIKTVKKTFVQTWIVKHINYTCIIIYLCQTSTIVLLPGTFVVKLILRKNQETALRFIYWDYSSGYESLLIKSQLPSLKVSRWKTIASEIFFDFE